jgi:hypothetical protein
VGGVIGGIVTTEVDRPVSMDALLIVSEISDDRGTHLAAEEG